MLEMLVKVVKPSTAPVYDVLEWTTGKISMLKVPSCR